MQIQFQPKPNLWTRYIHEPFLRAALLIALTAGFGYGAVMVAGLALGGLPGTWYASLVQAHGHAQLFGWLGCFILGMGLFFLPKLRGGQLKKTARLPIAFTLLVTGIVLRTFAQPLAGWFAADSIANVLRGVMLLASVLEFAALLILLSILVASERGFKALTTDAPAYPLQPFIKLAFVSFTAAFVFNVLGAGNAFTHARNVLAPRYEQTVILLMLYGVAIPMVITFSIRNLPLFLRLAMPSRAGWRALAFVYFGALFLRVLPNLVAMADDVLILTGRVLRANYINVLLSDGLAVIGALGLNACILLFVWRLDLLRRHPDAPRRKAQFESRFADGTEPPDPYRKPSRANYPDNGEYGRFELLVYAAFIWLVVAALLDVLRALPGVNEWLVIPQDAARHALFVGFITLLIFGMAVRMAPGFSGKRGVAHPDLALWLFVLGNLAALLRVVPTLFPQSEFALMLWGLSGFVGWCAVLVLAVMMWATFRKK